MTVLIGFWACKDNSKDSFINSTDNPNLNSKYNSINLQFNNPIVLDSSNWIIYPLILEELEETERDIISKSYERQHGYWNIAFYNTESKQTRLLSDSQKMLINSISSENDVMVHSGSQVQTKDKLIYYSIITNDFNQDGKLNFEDPQSLFISDLSGEKFRQISPEGLDLIHWQTIRSQNKIIIQARKDINEDKKFDSTDEIVVFIYDINNQKTEQIFSEEFNLTTKKLLESQWTKK